MLRYLRRYSNSTGIKILYAVLAGLFIIWGVGAIGGERVDVVARVQGQTITRTELERATAALQRRYDELLRGQLSPEMARALDFRGKALDQLIDQALIGHEAVRLGIAVDETELIDSIQRMPEFQENGRFDRDRVEQVLRFQRDRGEFEEQLRDSLVFGHVRSLVTDGVQVSDAEVEERYRRDHEQVNLVFARTRAADLAQGTAPTDDELRAYLTAHADRYRVPTTVRARYVVYRPADFLSQVELKDGEIAEYYELNKEDRFADPNGTGVKPLDAVRDQIVDTLRHERAFDLARRQAEADRRAIVRGTPFAQAVGDRSIQETAPFGAGTDVPGVGHAPEFVETALGLGPNEVSDLIETSDAIYVLTPFDRVEAHTPPLEEIHDRVAADVRREHGEAAAKERAEKLLARAREVGLEQAAAEASVPVEETGPFDRLGAIPKIGATGPELRTDAFALTSEAPLGPRVYSAGGDAVVVALKARTPADMSGFAAEKDSLRTTLLERKRQTVMAAYLDYLKERAHQQGELQVFTDKLARS
jgi:peptidyl-prolyl cis-trans isomerase D